MLLCRLDELRDGASRGFSVSAPDDWEDDWELDPGDDPLELFAVRRGDRVDVYVNRCPHLGTPLEWRPDRFLDEAGEHAVCATHGALFQLDDGLCVYGPCRGDRLQALAVELRGGDVHVALTEGDGPFAVRPRGRAPGSRR